MKKFDSFQELSEFMTETFNNQRSVLKHEPSKGEYNDQPSMTIPDQTLSLSELLDKYAKGQPLAQRIGTYDPTNTLPDLRTLDLAELEELKNQNAAYIAELEENRKTSIKTQTPPPNNSSAGAV